MSKIDEAGSGRRQRIVDNVVGWTIGGVIALVAFWIGVGIAWMLFDRFGWEWFATGSGIALGLLAFMWWGWDPVAARVDRWRTARADFKRSERIIEDAGVALGRGQLAVFVREGDTDAKALPIRTGRAQWAYYTDDAGGEWRTPAIIVDLEQDED